MIHLSHGTLLNYECDLRGKKRNRLSKNTVSLLILQIKTAEICGQRRQMATWLRFRRQPVSKVFHYTQLVYKISQQPTIYMTERMYLFTVFPLRSIR